MARKANKAAVVNDCSTIGVANGHETTSAKDAISDSDIAALAYQLWQQRGCPEGSPEEDWYQAQRTLHVSMPAGNN